jgi:putative membrane protein insertion efficiency factor
LVFLAAIEVFQTRISPIDGHRCGFSPTCSAFGRQAVREYGPIRGVTMTADRLMRCNIFKEPGPDYPLLPDGSLLDPPSRNLLDE